MMISSAVKDAQATNLKVWARRFNVVSNPSKDQNTLVKAGMGGSVTAGPISLMLSRALGREIIAVGVIRTEICKIVGRCMADEKDSPIPGVLENIEKELTSNGVSSVVVEAMVELASDALSRRAREYSSLGVKVRKMASGDVPGEFV